MGIQDRDWYKDHYTARGGAPKAKTDSRRPASSGKHSEVTQDRDPIITGTVFGFTHRTPRSQLIALYSILGVVLLYLLLGAALKAGAGIELPGFSEQHSDSLKRPKSH